MGATRPQPDASAASIAALPMATVNVLNLGLQIHQTELDCSHFVQYVFALAGKTFDYAPSRELFTGEVPEFKAVRRAEAGDLIVWRGHVGIIVNPREHTFLSSLNSGVKVARYDTHYWRKRGSFRFLRFSNSSTAESQPASQAD
ncbi:MAG: hypothetical protein NVS9B15_22330 [Acidobacteriaceae bacterium]